MSYTAERWFKLLTDACAAHPRGNQGVAEHLGVSRTMVSLVLGGSYGNPNRLATATLRAYDRRDCPHTGDSVEPETCRKKSAGPKPFGGNARLLWWQTCQSCPHKPDLAAPVGGKPATQQGDPK